MSSRDWQILFEDILDSISKIEDYTSKLSYDDFENNRRSV